MIRVDQMKALVALGMDPQLLQAVVEIIDRPCPKTQRNQRYEAKKASRERPDTVPESVPSNVPTPSLDRPDERPNGTISPFTSSLTSLEPLKDSSKVVVAREGTNGHAFPDSEDMDLALDAYNQVATQHKLPQARKLTETRRKKLKRRLIDVGSLAGWYEACRKLQHAKFLRGNNDKGWRADFDFLLQEQSFNRLLEGYYDDKAAVHSH
jgi:hypothetical protein